LNQKRWMWALGALTALLLIAGVALRFYYLSFHDNPALYPPKKNYIFDEVYFPVFADNYIHRQEFFDVHPPLGKLIIALGELLLGNNGLGWRIMPCLFGLGNIALMVALYRRIYKENVGAIALAGFLALDGMFLSYSRLGLMDGILFFATMFCVWTAARLDKDKLPGLLTAVALGLAIAIKWTALSAIVPMLWFALRHQRLRPFFAWLPLGAALYFGIVVYGQWLTKAPHPFQASIEWHAHAAHYHATLDKSHPWGSPWYTWPIELRPVLLLYDRLPGGLAQVMYNLGNPLLVWGSTLSVLGTLVLFVRKMLRKDSEDTTPPVPSEIGNETATPGLNEPEDLEPQEKPRRWSQILLHPTMPLVLGFLASWLPYAPVHRVMFLYHYMPAYGFALLIAAYWLGILAKKSLGAAVVLCFCAALVAWFMLPFALGYPKLTKDQVHIRAFIPRWL